jgi:hypothetical protein
VCTEIAVVSLTLRTMDIAGRRERADIADLISFRPTRLRSAVDQLLMLAILDDTEPAPGDVIENPGDL